MRIEGRIIVCLQFLSRFNLIEFKGFDEFMNVVIDEAEEVYQKKERRSIGESMVQDVPWLLYSHCFRSHSFEGR